jgi:hypothetical protein
MTAPFSEIAVMGLRGPKPRTVKEHIERGSYRRYLHGPKPPPPEDPEQAYIREAWKTILRLPDGPPRGPRKPDPLEELLQRDGIEITDADRAPAKPVGAHEPGPVRKDGRGRGAQ